MITRGRVLHPSDLDEDLISLWKRFCAATPVYRSPFYWPQFTTAVARARPDVRVAVLERASEVIGFLPFHCPRGSIAMPVGGHINDYHGPILAPDTSISAEELLSSARISAYDFDHLPVTFTNLAEQAHSFAASPQLCLARGYETYASEKGASWTKAQREVRRRHRKTEKDFGPVRFVFNDRSDAVYRQHVEMKNAQYERIGTRMRLRDDWVGATIEHLRHLQGAGFASVMSSLYAGDRLIAAHFGIRTANTLHWWFPSYDPELYKLGPGISLVDHCARAAESEGISLIDFGKGDEGFKMHFANRIVDLCEGSICRPETGAAFMRQGTYKLVTFAESLPLGRFKGMPRKAVARLVSGVAI